MPSYFDILWDEEPDGNVAHLGEHGVSTEEAESVLRRAFDHRKPSQSDPRRFVVNGFTDAGRYLVVVFEYERDIDLVIPVTAFEPEQRP